MWRVVTIGGLILCAVLTCGMLLAGNASAQNDSPVLEMLRKQQKIDEVRRAAPVVAAPSGDTPAARLPTRVAAPASVPQRRTYCVRTCDGYYFSIGFVSNVADLSSHETMCAASCGTEEMKLFAADVVLKNKSVSGAAPAIESAVDAGGALYTALPNAFAFRTGDRKACACQATTSGLPQIPLEIDATLRTGDIVVMPDGLKVFRGNKAGPHQMTDFISVAGAKSLSAAVRQQMLTLQTRISE